MSDGSPRRFFGKYRGTVVNPVDPMQLGRIQALVPDVLGLIPSSWAMPCFPVTGKQYGAVSLPQVGTGVWMEFEGGDPDMPIWAGCWYGIAAEMPAAALMVPPGVPGFVWQTTLQNSLMISDVPGPTGGIMIKTVTGAMISVSEIGITIMNGQGASIMLQGPSVIINAGALVVT